MSIPGFHSEPPLRASSGEDWLAPRAPLTGAVGPARPCCDACDDFCERYPNSRLCQSCWNNCMDCNWR